MHKSEGKYKGAYQEFHTLLDAIDDLLILLSPELKILWTNRSATKVIGKGTSGLYGQYCYKLWHKRTGPCDDCPATRSFQTGKTENTQYSTSDGRFWDIRTFPIKNKDGKINSVIEICKDITEETILQTESMKANQLEELGSLSASVAHEINNPIFGIINCAQLLLKEFKEGKDTDIEIVNMILKESNRIADITKGLFSFTTGIGDVKKNCNMHEIISDTLTLTRAMVQREGISIKTQVPRNLPEIFAHPQQMRQIFMNLISNSRYALNEKYAGAHKNKQIEIMAKEIVINDYPYIQATFCDRGNGIPNDKIDKVTGPFFTTKPGGNGVGMGLYFCNKIIKEHLGMLEIESREGNFTKVIINLPVKQ